MPSINLCAHGKLGLGLISTRPNSIDASLTNARQLAASCHIETQPPTLMAARSKSVSSPHSRLRFGRLNHVEADAFNQQTGGPGTFEITSSKIDANDPDTMRPNLLFHRAN
jgi:hypothetical protein